MLELIHNKIVQLLGGAILAYGIVLGLIRYGKKTERTKDRIKKMEDYISTKEKIDEVESSPDRDTAVDRLRRNGWL